MGAKKKIIQNNGINRYGNENMDLAARSEEISTHRISKDEQLPTDPIEVML